MSRIKRASALLTIAAYLGVLGYGVACHAVNYRLGQHPMMYFVVWDMFCGWSAYSNRMHVIAEGESGTYYKVTPTPWGEYHPYGRLGRQHYDAFGLFGGAIAANTLKHTRHEPILRVLVVEETWAKKYNIPDELWSRWYQRPKDIHKYCHVQSAWTPDGELLNKYAGWYAIQGQWTVTDNPRLQAEANQGRAFYAVNPSSRIEVELDKVSDFSDLMPDGTIPGTRAHRFGSPLGN